jgi:hypothetical protein
MIAFPWYLLAFGIFVVIVGSFFAGVAKPPGSGRRAINPKMRDDEIIRSLKRGQRVSLPNLVILFGLLCVMVSVIWRIVLMIASMVPSK